MRTTTIIVLCSIMAPFFFQGTLWGTLQGSLKAETVRSFESSIKQKEIKKSLKKTLQKLDGGKFKEKDQTLGFSFLYKSTIFSPFKYRIYGGTILGDQTILRLEGSSRDVKNISRIFALEGIISEKDLPETYGKKPRAMLRKSHTAGQVLNLIFPPFSVLYQYVNSPRLGVWQMILRTSLYLLSDTLAFLFTGNIFFTEPYNLRKNWWFLTLWLGAGRIGGSIQTADVIRGHNRLHKLGYTFYY